MHKSALIVTIFVFAATCGAASAARILMIVPIDAPSHLFLGDRLLKELASRGHEVTMVSSIKPTLTKNYRHIQLTGIKEGMMRMFPNEKSMNFLSMGQSGIWYQTVNIYQGGSMLTDITLANPNMQKMLNDSNEHFDLIIIVMFHTEALYGLADKYDAPVIVLNSQGSSMWSNYIVANPAPSTYVPNFFTNFTSKMSLAQRIYNTGYTILTDVYRRYVHFPKSDEILHKYFPTAPPLQDLIYNRTSMVFINSHPVISNPTPHVPAMVEIGGYHIQAPKPLPKDLQEFMDDAPHGVILFSMGSNIKSTDLDSSIRNILFKTFSRLKQKVIWKFEDENILEHLDNVKIMKWCPQNDVMAHPNLKLFISHGGISSLTETVHYGVPIIGIPIFADQKMNIAMMVEKGYGLTISYHEITEENLFGIIQEVVLNPKYRNEIQKASQILRGQPVSPLESAVFWTEHVIKHRGAKHFRSAALDLEWYQLYSIDIISIVLVVFLLFCYTIIYGFKFLKYKISTYFSKVAKKNV